MNWFTIYCGAVSQPIEIIAFFSMNNIRSSTAPISRIIKYCVICLISLRSVFTALKCFSEPFWAFLYTDRNDRFPYPFIQDHTAISRKVVRKGARYNPERYCGWFWVHGSLKKFERMTREAVDICLRALKESNKSRFDSRSVRNSVLIISHITFRDCRLHIFSDNLSRNSSILQLVKSPPPFHIPKAWKNYPFGRSLLVKAIIGSTPPGDLHYLKEKLHVYTINDIQLLKMYRLSCKSLGEQEHPRLEGSENLIIL